MLFIIIKMNGCINNPIAKDNVPSIPDAPRKPKHLIPRYVDPENVIQSLIGVLAESIIGMPEGIILGSQ